MPRKNKWRTKLAQSSSDVTVHDYANASTPAGRPKKCNTIATEDSWEKRNYDDLLPGEDEEGNRSFVCATRRSESSGRLADEPPANDYPEILYYLISRYVRPEDIGRFAGINRATYALSKREGFWRRLFRRHCERSANKLPQRLDIERGFRLYGLRQRVVRALYHTYPPFIAKAVTHTREHCEPRDLIGRRCANLWYTQGADCWLYYIKLKRSWSVERLQRDLLRLLEDVDANPEEHSRLMLVKSKQFHALPPAMGMLLVSVSTQLVQGFSQQRLQLGFARGPHTTRHHAPELTLLLDNVKEVQVLDWWHPRYPHFDAVLPPPTDDPDNFLLRNNFSCT